MVNRIKDINWEEWQATEEAVVTYLENDNQILLIEKLRGFGKGKITAPGGRIDRGEKSIDAAIREFKEEVGLDVYNLKEVGVLYFHFTSGYKMKAYIYYTSDFSGELVDTDEAKPFWKEKDLLPFSRMWADDCFWLSYVLQGKGKKKVLGYFLFSDEETIISQEINYY